MGKYADEWDEMQAQVDVQLASESQQRAQQNLQDRGFLERTAIGGLRSAQSALTGAKSYIEGAFGDEIASEESAREASRYKQAGAEQPPDVPAFLPSDSGRSALDDPLSFGKFAIEQLGRSVPEMGIRAGGAALGGAVAGPAGALIGGLATSSSLHTGRLYSDLREKGIDAPGTSLAFGIAMGAVENLIGTAPAINRMLNIPGFRKTLAKAAVGKGTKAIAGALWDVGKGVVKTSAGEGAEEGFQEVLSMINEDMNDPNFKWNRDKFIQVIEAYASGAVVGGATGGAGSIKAQVSAYIKQKAEVNQNKAKDMLNDNEVLDDDTSTIAPQVQEQIDFLSKLQSGELTEVPGVSISTDVDEATQRIYPEADPELNKLSRDELKVQAQEMGIDATGMRKTQIIEAIGDFQAQAENALLDMEQEDIAPEPTEQELIEQEFGPAEERETAGAIEINAKRMDKALDDLDVMADRTGAMDDAAFREQHADIVSELEDAISKNQAGRVIEKVNVLKKKMRSWRSTQFNKKKKAITAQSEAAMIEAEEIGAGAIEAARGVVIDKRIDQSKRILDRDPDAPIRTQAATPQVTQSEMLDTLGAQEQPAYDESFDFGANAKQEQESASPSATIAASGQSPYREAWDYLKRGIKPEDTLEFRQFKEKRGNSVFKAKKSQEDALTADQYVEEIISGDDTAAQLARKLRNDGVDDLSIIDAILSAHREHISRETEAERQGTQSDSLYDDAKELADYIDETFTEHEDPANKQEEAENKAIETAEDVRLRIIDQDIAPTEAVNRLERAIEATEEPKPSKAQESTILEAQEEAATDVVDVDKEGRPVYRERVSDEIEERVEPIKVKDTITAKLEKDQRDKANRIQKEKVAKRKADLVERAKADKIRREENLGTTIPAEEDEAHARRRDITNKVMENPDNATEQELNIASGVLNRRMQSLIDYDNDGKVREGKQALYDSLKTEEANLFRLLKEKRGESEPKPEPKPELTRPEKIKAKVKAKKEAKPAEGELFGESDPYERAINIASQITTKFKRHARPSTKGQLAENHAINVAEQMQAKIKDKSIKAPQAEKQLEQAMADAEKFAKDDKKPAQLQEETLFDITPDDELNLGDTAVVPEVAKKATEKIPRGPYGNKGAYVTMRIGDREQGVIKVSRGGNVGHVQALIDDGMDAITLREEGDLATRRAIEKNLSDRGWRQWQTDKAVWMSPEHKQFNATKKPPTKGEQLKAKVKAKREAAKPAPKTEELEKEAPIKDVNELKELAQELIKAEEHQIIPLAYNHFGIDRSTVRPAQALRDRLAEYGLTDKAALRQLMNKFSKKKTPAKKKAEAMDKIEDFGEKIGGAKKDTYTRMSDDLNSVSDADIATQPLSKIWPLPNYKKMLEDGVDAKTVSFIRALREGIPSKPRSRWRLNQWVKLTSGLRQAALSVIDQTVSLEKAVELFEGIADSSEARGVIDQMDLYNEVGHEKSLAGIRISSGSYSMYKGVEYKPIKTIHTVEKAAKKTAFSNFPNVIADGDTREEAISNFKKAYKNMKDDTPAKRQATFDIYSYEGKPGFIVGKKVGRNYIDLAGPFDTIGKAREHKANSLDELIDKLAKAKEVPSERRDTNNPRVGEDMRMGKDVTPEMFGDAFGFKGVEFGNWVEQGKRQSDLNDTYDSLMDMAALLGIPPKAISLNGELSMAFGARGSGGKKSFAAHYEPDKIVINLTKKKGAGSLGHEWWHAVDDYFERMRKRKGMMTEAWDVDLSSRGAGFQAYPGVRTEMIEAFGEVMKQINSTALQARSSKIDAKRTKAYWTTAPEMSARAFESYLIAKLQDNNASNDHLANIVDEATWKAAESMGFELDGSYPYPTAGEIPAINAAFKKLFDTIETKETDKGVMMYKLDTTPKDKIAMLDEQVEATKRNAMVYAEIIRNAKKEIGEGVTHKPALKHALDWLEMMAQRAELTKFDKFPDRPNLDSYLPLYDDAFSNATAAQKNDYREAMRQAIAQYQDITKDTGQFIRFSLSDSTTPARTITTESVQATFPGSRVTKKGNRITVSLESGARFSIVTTEAIPTDTVSVMRDYGVSRAEAERMARAGALGATVPMGANVRLSDGQELDISQVNMLIQESKGSNQTVRHEGLHIAKELGFFNSTYGKALWKALEFEYRGENDNITEENIANAREVWTGQNGLWGKIVQWFQRLKAQLGFDINPDAALNETFTEQFWSQGVDRSKGAGTSYSAVDQTQTPAFQKWFGDSKVVDEDGDPLVVYHGTDADFNEFDTRRADRFGSHFGTIESATQAKASTKKDGEFSAKAVYLKIDNPIKLPDLKFWTEGDLAKELESLGISVPKKAFQGDSFYEYSDIIKAIKDAGYDGVEYVNSFEDKGSTSYIVFNPTQIKSATDNVGTFDPANPDIRYHMDPVTSIKNDVVNEMRAMRDADEITPVEAETQQEWLDEAVDVLNRDFSSGARLISELTADARVLTDRETAIVQVHYRREYNVFREVSNALFQAQDTGNPTVIARAQTNADNQLAVLNKIEEVTRSAGREWGRAGVARQIALKKDFSLEGMERKARVANGGKALNRDQMADVKKLADTVERLEKRLKEEANKVSGLESTLAHKTLMDEEIEKSRKLPQLEMTKEFSDDVDKGRNIMASLGFLKKKKAGPGLKFKLDEDAEAAPGEQVIEELYETALSLAKNAHKSGVTGIGSFLAVLRNEYGDITEAEYTFARAWNEYAASVADPTVVAPAKAKPKATPKAKPAPAKAESKAAPAEVTVEDAQKFTARDITNHARAIQRELVTLGITEQNEVINAVHESLQAILPGMTRAETVDALSGYGQFSKPARDEVSRAIRELNALHLQLSKHNVLNDAIAKTNELREQGLSDDQIAKQLIKEGLQLKATGYVRDTPSDLVRHMTAQTNELKKELPAMPAAKAGQLQTALDARKRATENRIKDLNWMIRNKKRIVQKRNVLRPDADLIALHKERDGLIKDYNAMAKSEGWTDEQRAATTIASLDRAIAKAKDDIASKNVFPVKNAPMSNAEIDAKRAELAALNAEKQAIRDMINPKMTPEQRAAKNYEASVLRRVADYQDRIANNDFTTKKRKIRELSDNELKLKRRLEEAKQQFLKKAGEYQLANMSPMGKALDYVKQTAHLSRALMTSIDLSAVFRQGGITVYSHPKLALEAGKKMIKALVSKQEHFNSAEAIRNDKLGQFAETAGLSITSDDGRITKQEEAYMGRWSEKIPGVAGSGRAYTTFLNNMRFKVFKTMVESIGKNGQVTKDEAKVIAKYINAATGRADFKALNNAAANLNTVFFAPRYVASRFQYLSMPFMLPFMNTTPRVKKMIAKEYARSFGGAAVFIGSLLALGALTAGSEDEEPTFELDPRSTDFMKIKIGETRIDPMAGLQQVMVFSTKVTSGQTKSPMSGKVKSLSDSKGPYAQTRWTVAGRFLRTKLGPIPGATVTMMDDMTDVVGQKHTYTSMAGGLFVPLSVREVVDTMVARGYTRGSVISTMALFGMGVGTYGSRTQYLAATKEERKKIFEKDLRRVRKDGGDIPYSDKMTPFMMKKYRIAKRHAQRKKK